MIDAMFEYTFLTLKITPQPKSVLGLLVAITANSAVRLGTVYLIIRVLMTAFSHGSF